jgi:hypothetical protein
VDRCAAREEALRNDENAVNELHIRLSQEEEKLRIRAGRLQEMEIIAAEKYLIVIVVFVFSLMSLSGNQLPASA